MQTSAIKIMHTHTHTHTTITSYLEMVISKGSFELCEQSVLFSSMLLHPKLHSDVLEGGQSQFETFARS